MSESVNFACLAFQNISASFPDGIDRLEVGPGLYLSSRCPFDLDFFWRAELGRIREEQLLDCNLAIVAYDSGAAHGKQEADLFDLATRTLYGLMLQGMPYMSGKGVSMAGEIRSPEGPRLWTHGNLLEYRHVAGSETRTIDRDSMLAALGLAEGIAALFSDTRSGALRVRRGFAALERGLRERRAHDRLHCSVRALEALLIPDIGKTRRQFIERAQTFAESSEEIVGEIYDLRSKVEHMHFWREALPATPDSEAEHRGTLRALQAERIALSCYERIVGNDSVRALFDEEDAIRAFWALPPSERAPLWGRPLEVASTVLRDRW